MPFKSKAQQGFMFAKHPRLAREMAHKTPNMKGLPERAAIRKKIASKKRGKYGK